MQPSWRRRFLTWQVIRANRLILVVRAATNARPELAAIAVATIFFALTRFPPGLSGRIATDELNGLWIACKAASVYADAERILNDVAMSLTLTMFVH
jgi:hypothetical protein